MKFVHGLSLAVLCAAAPVAANAAQSIAWPSEQITWVVGFAPGGTADVLTRIAARELAQNLGKVVVVENRSGASGAIALQYVARSGPSAGLLITVPGPVVFPTPQPTIGAELAPIALMAQGPMVVVGPTSNAKAQLKDVVADAKLHPQTWSYGSSGNGTSQHLAGELLNQQAGTQIEHVPYKGGGQALSDVAGGQIPLAILGPTPVLPQIKAGHLKAYAVTTPYRIKSLPDVPTMQEAGFAGYDASQWFAVATSKATPTADLDQMNQALNDVFASPAFQAALEMAGMVSVRGSKADLLSFIATDNAKWDALIKSGKIVLPQ